MPVTIANNDYPTLDGIAPSWADVSVRLKGSETVLLDMRDIKSISTGRKVDEGVQKAGGRVMQRTSGEGSQDASCTLYQSGYIKLIRNLSKVAPKRGNIALIRFVHFGIDFQYTPPGSTEIFERRLKGCFVKEDDMNGSEGSDAATVDVTLSVIEIVDVVDGVEVALI